MLAWIARRHLSRSMVLPATLLWFQGNRGAGSSGRGGARRLVEGASTNPGLRQTTRPSATTAARRATGPQTVPSLIAGQNAVPTPKTRGSRASLRTLPLWPQWRQRTPLPHKLRPAPRREANGFWTAVRHITSAVILVHLVHWITLARVV